MNIPEVPCLDMQRDQRQKVPPCFAPASMHVSHILECIAINMQKFFGSPAGVFKAWICSLGSMQAMRLHSLAHMAFCACMCSVIIHVYIYK